MTVRHGRGAATALHYHSLLADITGALALGSAMLSGCENHVDAASVGSRPPMKVTVASASQTDVPITGEWIGTLDGYVNAQIQP
jgi:membrane fusion protein (multidrug efflux system)